LIKRKFSIAVNNSVACNLLPRFCPDFLGVATQLYGFMVSGNTRRKGKLSGEKFGSFTIWVSSNLGIDAVCGTAC